MTWNDLSPYLNAFIIISALCFLLLWFRDFLNRGKTKTYVNLRIINVVDDKRKKADVSLMNKKQIKEFDKNLNELPPFE